MADIKKQFLYVLKLIPALRKEENWTPREEKIVGEHFASLEQMLEEGRLILAGKTAGLDEKTFGIVIFEAASEQEAQDIMQNDPAVRQGIMRAELFPYQVALMRKE